MKTKIKIIHEEEYSDKSKIIGVLYNFSIEKNDNYYNTLFFVLKNEVYVFFETLVDLIDYTFYGNFNVKCYYQKEGDFDVLYDKENINGNFIENITAT